MSAQIGVATLTVTSPPLTITFLSAPADNKTIYFQQASTGVPTALLPNSWASVTQDLGWVYWGSSLSTTGTVTTLVNNVHWAQSNGNFTGTWADITSAPPVTNASPAQQSVTATTTSATPSSSSPTATDSSSGTASTSSAITSIASTSSGTPSTATTTALQASGTVISVVSKKGGLSGGAVAGVAVGCLIAGALIAGLFLFFCLGRSRNRRQMGDREGTALAFLPQEKGPVAKAHSLESGSPVSHALQNGLPQPLEDKAITGDVSKLEILIKNHVQSYYHSRQVSAGLLDLDTLHALGDGLPISTGSLSTLLGNPETRDIALRFVIAWVTVSRMDANSDSKIAFLPAEIAECYEAISSADGASRAHGLFLANWRRITAELLQSSHSAQSTSTSVNHRIAAAISILDPILQTYAEPQMDNSQRRRNLEEILRRAAAFAFTLFAQPSSWTFDWKEEQSVRSGSLCIFPALIQVADETGAPLKPPRPFSEAMIRTLDG